MATGALGIAQLAVWATIVFGYRSPETWLPFVFDPAAPTPEGVLIAPFVHWHPAHLGVNLAVLWLFGPAAERALGSLRFLLLFLAGAWCATAMHWAVVHAFQVELLYTIGTDLGSGGAAFGSSGAVAAVLGVYWVRFPHRLIRLPFLPRLPIQPLTLLGAWLMLELIQAVYHTVRNSPAAVSHWAHFAGFLFGIWYARAARLHRVARAEQLREAAEDAAVRGETDAAARAWSVLLAEDPDNSELRRILAAARETLGDREGARALAAESLARVARAGHAKQAVADYEHFHQLLPGLQLPHGVRFRIGCWQSELGNPAAAYETLLHAAAEDASTPGAAAALYRAGEIAAERLNDPLRARQAWRRLLTEEPDSAFHERARQRLQALSTKPAPRRE